MPTCSVKGCGKSVHARKLCGMHYERMRTTGDVGEAEARQAKFGEPLAWLESVVLRHKDKKKCLIWPFGRIGSGHAQLRYRGRSQLVGRIICIKVHGKAPGKTHEGCHSCGKGHEGCVNPHHLYWGTRQDNAADKRKHGTHIHGERSVRAKLTDAKVREIIQRLDRGWSERKLARKYKVTSTAIHHISVGKTWKHIER